MVHNGHRDRLVLVCFLILAADFPMGFGVDEQKQEENASAAPLTQGSYLHSHFKRWGRNAKKDEG